MESLSLQERFAPSSLCFGCGPANKKGLRIRSRIKEGQVVASWTPRLHHHAFGKFLNGGIISTILDCHSNWAGAYALMVRSRAKVPPPTVTASFFVEFLRPTPIGPLLLEAKTIEIIGPRAVVESTLTAAGKVTARFRGTFVAVNLEHPAATRWKARRSRA